MANEERINKIIDELTLFDDDLMSRVFDKNIEATEYVLQIILGRKITVVSVKGQENFKNPVTNGRNITLDVHAEEEDGQEIDIEVQGGAEGAHTGEKGARYENAADAGTCHSDHGLCRQVPALLAGCQKVNDLLLQGGESNGQTGGGAHPPVQ